MNKENEIEIIRNHVVQFRVAIDKARRDDWKGNMKSFPAECCHHACSLLLLYFQQIGLEGFDTLVGKHPFEQEKKHQWLQKRQIVVDITADQFHGIEDRAIVARNSSWHAALEGKFQSPPADPKEIWDWYATIYQDISDQLPQ